MQKKAILLLMACLVLLMGGASRVVTTAATQAGAATFKTPEEAITSYLEGVAQGDFGKIMQATAVDEMSQNFKFDLYIDRLRAFVPIIFPSPANYPFYVDLNKAQISSQISNQVKIFAFSLLSTEPVADGKTILMDIDRANAFIKAVDPKRLAQLEVKTIVLPNKKLMSDARYQDNAAKMARVYGADESTERVALFTFEQTYYFVGFTLLRYGDNWKISSQTSPLANTSATGAPQKTSVQDFGNMTNGN